MNEITKELLEALKSCERVMSVELNGLAVIQPELKEARAAIKKAETVLAEPQADEDGWIPWSGGECPIEPPAHNLFIRFRIGTETSDYKSRAQSYFWLHEERAHSADIIAYRIAKGADE